VSSLKCARYVDFLWGFSAVAAKQQSRIQVPQSENVDVPGSAAWTRDGPFPDYPVSKCRRPLFRTPSQAGRTDWLHRGGSLLR
jgi:hypothetical protein